MKGGARPGAGRKHGSGKWGCKTVLVRVPEHLKAEALAWVASRINGGPGGEVRVASTGEAGRSPVGLPTPSVAPRPGHRECPQRPVGSGGDPAPTAQPEGSEGRISRLEAAVEIGRTYILGALSRNRGKPWAMEIYRRDLASLNQALGQPETPTNGD